MANISFHNKKDERRGVIAAIVYTIVVIILLFLIAFRESPIEFIEITMGMEANQGVSEQGGMVESTTVTEETEADAASSEAEAAPSQSEPLYTEENDIDYTVPDAQEVVNENSNDDGSANSDETSTTDESNSESNSVNNSAIFNPDIFNNGPSSDDNNNPDVLDGGGPNPGGGELDGVKGYGNNPFGNGDGVSKFVPQNNTDYRGKIYVEVTVDKNGNVTGAKVKGNLSDPGWTVLEAAVLEAAKKWTFPSTSVSTTLSRKGELVFNFEKQ